MELTQTDIDDVKEIFSEMSLRVLALTYAISMHMLFDFLASK